MSIKIYHNPKCRISREALKLIRAQGIEPVIVDYLKDPPPRSELIALLNHLHLSPKDIIRDKEAEELGIDKKDPDLTRLLGLIAKNPKVIERPIVVTSKAARICRPPELVNELFQ